MAKQTILWTVLPHGRVTDGEFAGHFRVSVVVSPRLTPQAAGEQQLQAFPEFLDWPATLAGARLELKIGASMARLIPLTTADSTLWGRLFGAATPVAGFEFKDMSTVNLRSYAVRNVLGFLRRHYGRLAVQAASAHPTLLPWNQAHPDLRAMLQELGTRTHGTGIAGRPVPGFARFFEKSRTAIEQRLTETVFGPGGRYRAPILALDAEPGTLPGHAGHFTLRVLPADWQEPVQGGTDPVMSLFHTADEYSLYQACRFYHREPATNAQREMRRPSFADIAAPPTEPEYDFHRRVASYASYPLLLRALGLVVDCAVEDGAAIDALVAAGGGSAVGQMSLSLTWPGPHPGDATPRTAWHADRERFVTRPRTTDHERGLLRLQDANDGWDGTSQSAFDVYQIDPDGAALKTVGFTLTAQNLVAKSLSPKQLDGEVTYTTGNTQGVAALRSGGLGVSRHDRATQIAQDSAANALKNSAVEAGGGAQLVLFAEDVLRGYRLDVAPVPDAATPGRWHTLCAREGTYRIIAHDELVQLPADEGYVSGASTTSAADPAADPDNHYLHESVFRWTGWSLCTPRPGLALRSETVPGTQLQGEVPTTVTDEAENGSGIAATFRSLPGSLPRLRFGQRYRLRARMVDLAGNSLAVDDPTLGDFENATAAVGYWRFEPVDPPVIVHRHRLSEGESLERMVIRSNYDVDAVAYPGTPDFAAAIEPDSDFEYPPASERHIVPPKASQLQCEQHGLFDRWFGDPLQIRDGYAIAARESGTLYDEVPGAQIELVTPRSLDGIADANLPPALPSEDNPVGDRITGGQYVIHREALITTPYLPDGASAGIALRAVSGSALPGITDAMIDSSNELVLGPGCVVYRAPDQSLVLLVANAGDWPYTQGLRIVLAERPAALTDLPCAEAFADDGRPTWDENERVLTFRVAKGRIVRLVYSSFVHPDFASSFGLPHWTSGGGEADFVLGMAGLGCHWMMAPYRTLTLVHATQQPVCQPELIKAFIHRSPGAQHADLICRSVRLHGPSTGKIEVEADWEEWVDDLARSGPERVSGHGQLGEVQLLAEDHPDEFSLQEAVAAQQVDPGRPRARGDRHEFGDTRFRLVRYRLRASTRFREYLMPSLYAQRDLVTRLGPIAVGPAVKAGPDDDPGAPVLLDPGGAEENLIVPASDAPDDPRVLYVVPTFRWEHSETGDVVESTRIGNGLRVWLDRPWFSSGDGELLGVIIFRDAGEFTDIPAPMQPLVTQWGLDPLWDTALPRNRTRVTDFAARVHAEPLSLQERPGGPAVHVIGHRVQWDIERRLWFCDIELDPGTSYMPFIRLALVRYQPNALPGAKVSKVVLAEFSQVLPRRRARFDRDRSGVSLTLTGVVPHYGPMKSPRESEYDSVPPPTGGPHETGRNRVELVLQTRDPALDSDLAWRDTSVLASKIVAPPGAASTELGPIGEQSVVAAPGGRTVQTRAGGEVRLGAAVTLGATTGSIAAAAAAAGRGTRGVAIPSDPLIWKVTATLPESGREHARLLVREFERYYTDRTVPERQTSGSVWRRRVVEERLVYAVVCELP